MFLLLISFIGGILGLLMPAIHKFIFNSVIPSGTSEAITGISVLLAGTVIVTALIHLARSVWVMHIGNKIELRLQNAVWGRLMSLPVSFFQKYDSGELTQRAVAVNEICNILSSQLIPTILSGIFSLLYLFQIAKLEQTLLLPSVIILLLILSVYLFTIQMQTKRSVYNNHVHAELSDMTFQLFNGITKIKVSGSEVQAFSKWSHLYSKLSLIPDKFLIFSGGLVSMIAFFGTIMMYYLAFLHNMNVSDYIAFNTAYSLLMGAVISAAGIASQLASLSPAMEMLKPILETAPEHTGFQKHVARLTGDIEVSHVRFRYQEDLPYVLNDLNLHIKAGEYLGVVGASGCGKSTLFRLLLGFEKPESGALYFDSQDMDGLDLRSIRQRIGVVLQDGKLFSGDIYSNIVVSAPWLSMDDAWVAAEKSGFAEDIRHMPMGMFTMISENGGGLSGGQKQRLLIARALASKPDIIMFDEATSALDNLTQAMVVQTLEQMDCTRIVIAHRLSTIKNCSRIIYLHEGKIAEQGTYEELMKFDGKFAELAKRQLA